MTDASDSKRDFFVSFNQADRAWATWIAWALEAAGYSVFFQDWDFKGNFVLEMDRAHTQSRRTIAVLSPDYLTSRFTAPEWAARFAQDATSQHDPLIPVRVRPCELEGLLAQIVYVDLVGCNKAAAKKRLLDRASGIRMKPGKPPLYPSSTAGHRTVPRPHFPGVVRTAGRWLHQVVIDGDIAPVVIGALPTWCIQCALAIWENVLDLERPGVAQSLNNLALLYWDTGRYAEAEPLFQRSIAILEKALPLDHPHLMRVRENYAGLLDQLGRPADTVKLRTQTPVIR